MGGFLRKYVFSVLTVGVIWYLSFFHPPRIALSEEVPFFDKWVHTAMYCGLCLVIWTEYLRAHRTLQAGKLALWAVAAPIAMSGAIELLQEYCTTYRGGDWFDLLANSVGVLLGTALGYWAVRSVVWRKR